MTAKTFQEKAASAKAKVAAAKESFVLASGVKFKNAPAPAAKPAAKRMTRVVTTPPSAAEQKKATTRVAQAKAVAEAGRVAKEAMDALVPKKPAEKRATPKPAAPEPFDLESAAEAEVAAGVSVEQSEDSMKRLVKMGQLMLLAEVKMMDAEIKFSEAKEAFRKLEQGDLPDLMREIGLTTFKMADGSVFDLVEDVQCGISEERRPAAHRWIREHGFGGLIATEIKASFVPDEIKKADALEKDMIKKGLFPDRKESIHHSRLKSFVKERLEAGDDIPFETFAIHQFDKVKVKQPKQPKGKR